MAETPPAPEDSLPEWLQEALGGRLASLVHIMKGRRSIRSGLGVLVLDGGVLTLTDAKGTSLFSVPVASVEARPQRRRLAVRQIFFQVHAGERWWYLTAHVLSKYSWRSTRDLAEHSGVREQLPQPVGMDAATYAQRLKQPSTHQVIWAACWLQVLSMLGKRDSAS
jgi:S-methylmethionine-dependent homocysteine/selenocysteine methylase